MALESFLKTADPIIPGTAVDTCIFMWLTPAVDYRYVWEHLDVGYVQGMCDLVAPLLVIFDDGKRSVFVVEWRDWG